MKINQHKTESALILQDIRSTYNVGAIFRTADALGISKIYLVGITPTPLDRFGRIRQDVAKSALGAEKNIPWESGKTISSIIRKLKKENYMIIGLEQAPNSIDYKKVKAKGPTAFILGNEVKGISKTVLKSCDIIAEIPMGGKKESLNVSVAAGVALFRILDN
jgi:tRNA G18 (ribose-2'-O)-methylase SpoU